jgi:hypothetical protein
MYCSRLLGSKSESLVAWVVLTRDKLTEAPPRVQIRWPLPIFQYIQSLPHARSLDLIVFFTVTVVGYGMKQQRYEDVHRAALRWPRTAFRYIGIDNDTDVEADYLGEVRSFFFPEHVS